MNLQGEQASTKGWRNNMELSPSKRLCAYVSGLALACGIGVGAGREFGHREYKAEFEAKQAEIYLRAEDAHAAAILCSNGGYSFWPVTYDREVPTARGVLLPADAAAITSEFEAMAEAHPEWILNKD